MGGGFRGFITTKFSITENEKHLVRKRRFFGVRKEDEVDFDCKISKCGLSTVAFETFAIKHIHTQKHNFYLDWIKHMEFKKGCCKHGSKEMSRRTQSS